MEDLQKTNLVIETVWKFSVPEQLNLESISYVEKMTTNTFIFQLNLLRHDFNDITLRFIFSPVNIIAKDFLIK